MTPEPQGLHLLALVADAPAAALLRGVTAAAGDHLDVVSELPAGLAQAAAEAPDAVFVEVSLAAGAGLAAVHHLRALLPSVSVIALAPPAALELATQAVALGGVALLLLPLSGDEVLSALALVRERAANRDARRALELSANRTAGGLALVARLATASAAPTRRAAAEQALAAVLHHGPAHAAAIYAPAGEASSQLVRLAHAGLAPEPPAHCDELAVLEHAATHDLAVLRPPGLSAGALLVLAPADPEDPLPLADAVTSQLALLLALTDAREQSSRGAMKDPSSSAYTFAYFVDVAGREIDKARRHARRFALATIALPALPPPPPASQAPTVAPERARSAPGLPRPAPPPASAPTSSQSFHPSVAIADQILGAVRDTDVLARVDDDEFYLLMPETGGLGANTCRRRIARRLTGLAPDAGGAASIGVATFPHDGTDLSLLLRVAKSRAEATRRSIVTTRALDRLPLAELVDALLEHAEDAPPAGAADPGAPRGIELPAIDLVGLALGAVAEALRGGAARVVATQRHGISVGSAVRALVGREDTTSQWECVDLGQSHGLVDVEALVIVAEHGGYVLVGRATGGGVRAVHAADPVLADLVIERLSEASGRRLAD
ncbi:MAG: diguanylate cyclase [Polyangiaceae bacterium]|nr:diguanylate cyclase [Polyangiaceae bacterium]